MRWSQSLIPTLKETPADAEIVSHKLLLRAGLIRKLSGGLYTFLPLGLRALRKVEQIVREEMNRAGALEVLMPALQPPEIWQQSGRYESARDVLFKVRDRAKKEWLLGPTHEEVITSLVSGEISSYRQMPKNFYQIQTKFRDEIRPRFGLMRAKEFIMKDAYSFDSTDEGAQVSYKKMYDAYGRIFKRCGLKTMPVEADTGVMGGKFSHEFMVPAETGENEVAYCDGCGYAANVEKAISRGPLASAPKVDASTVGAVEKFATPGVTTIERVEQAAARGEGGVANQDAGLPGGEQDSARAAAGRRSTERIEAHGRAGHGEFPGSNRGGNFRGARGAPRQPGGGERFEVPGVCRCSAAGCGGHDDGGERGRVPPAARLHGTGYYADAIGRSCGRCGRASIARSAANRSRCNARSKWGTCSSWGRNTARR